MKHVARFAAILLAAVLVLEAVAGALGASEDVQTVALCVVLAFGFHVWPRMFADDRPPSGPVGWLAIVLLWSAAAVFMVSD